MPFHPRTDRLQGAGTLILRIAIGVVLIAHGLQKAMGFDAWADFVRQLGIPVPDLMAGLAMAAELGGGAMLLLGLLTPVAAAFVAVDMIVAIAKVRWGHGLMAADGGFEYELLLAATAIFLMLHGPGRYSADAWIAARARRPEERRAAPFPPGAPAAST